MSIAVLMCRVRAALGPACEVVARIDGAGDCRALRAAQQAESNTTFVTRAEIDAALCAAVPSHAARRTGDGAPDARVRGTQPAQPRGSSAQPAA